MNTDLNKDLKIAVAGTGYVGLSIATLLAQHHQVTAVDVIPEKVEMLNRKQSPIQDDYIEKYLADNLKLKIKRSWQIFPVEVRGIDFIGYVFYHGHTLLRKDIKKKFIHKLSYKSNNKRLASLAAYWGWCKYGNCHNLWYRFTRYYNFKDYRQKLLSDDGIKKSTG